MRCKCCNTMLTQLEMLHLDPTGEPEWMCDPCLAEAGIFHIELEAWELDDAEE